MPSRLFLSHFDFPWLNWERLWSLSSKVPKTYETRLSEYNSPLHKFYSFPIWLVYLEYKSLQVTTIFSWIRDWIYHVLGFVGGIHCYCIFLLCENSISLRFFLKFRAFSFRTVSLGNQQKSRRNVVSKTWHCFEILIISSKVLWFSMKYSVLCIFNQSLDTKLAQNL